MTDSMRRPDKHMFVTIVPLSLAELKEGVTKRGEGSLIELQEGVDQNQTFWLRRDLEERLEVIVDENDEVDHFVGEGSEENWRPLIQDLQSITGRVLYRVPDVRTDDEIMIGPYVVEARELPIGIQPYSDILAAEHEMFDRVWYNRHMQLVRDIQRGRIKVIEDSSWRLSNHAATITKSILEQARKAAQKLRDKYGKGSLENLTDYELGMLSGKLSALRWVLGDEWDFLDT